MIRLATVNAGTDNDDPEQRLTRLIDQLEAERVDILCCQQVFATDDGRFNTAAALAARLGMTCTYSAAGKKKGLFRGRRVPSTSGMAILTGDGTWMLSSGRFSLQGRSGIDGPLAQYAVVRKNWNIVLVVNVLFPEAADEREIHHQLREMSSHPVMNNEYAAILFCGHLVIDQYPGALVELQKKTACRVSGRFPAPALKPGQENRKDTPQVLVLEKRRRSPAVVTMAEQRRPASITADESRKTPVPEADIDMTMLQLRINRIPRIKDYATLFPCRGGQNGREPARSF